MPSSEYKASKLQKVCERAGKRTVGGILACKLPYPRVAQVAIFHDTGGLGAVGRNRFQALVSDDKTARVAD